MSLQLRSPLSFKRLVDRDSAWPGNGVLATGAFSSLLWVHGPVLFRGHLTPLLLCLIALPIIGGILTPEKPVSSTLIFGLGSYPPLNDVPPIPIALVPFLRTYENLRYGLYTSIWQVLVFDLLFMVAIASVVAVVMSLFFAPLVFLGWQIRRRFGSSPT